MPPFYTRIEPDPALARGYIALVDAIAAYRIKGELAKAEQVRAILTGVNASYERLAVRAAGKADVYIRDRLRQTAVRPQTSGRLETAVLSLPLPPVALTRGVVLHAGAIGIADLPTLEHGTVNPANQRFGSYWRAQEYGLPVNYDARPAPGYFQPGSSRPDPGQFRNHPYFQQEPYARGMPALVRRRALRARHFLRDGAAETARWHAQERARINHAAVSNLARI